MLLLTKFTGIAGYKYIKHNAASPSMVSEDLYNTVQGWITECVLSHDDCPGRGTAEMPTRVLDVSFLDGIVKIHETKWEKGQYAALSYCCKCFSPPSYHCGKAFFEHMSVPATLPYLLRIFRSFS